MGIIIIVIISLVLKTLNTNTKITKGSQKTRRMNIFYFHSGYLKPYPVAACAARNYGPCALIMKKRRRRPDRETDRKMERQTDRDTGT